jgi:hypothetical protein
MGPMLKNLSDDIAECYRHAVDCAQKAKSEGDARVREDFLDMERRWLFLARSYEFTDQLDLLTNEPEARPNGRR